MSDLQLANGMDYGCEWLETGDARSASVVVAAPPVVTLPPSIEVNSNATLTCSVEYGSRHDALLPNQQPLLAMYLDGIKVGETTNTTFISGQTHRLDLSHIRVLTADDSGKEMACTVTATASQYSETTTAVVNVNHAVAEVSVDPAEIKSHYTVDENVTCIANGYPEPSYLWRDLNDTSRTFPDQVLLFESFPRDREYFMVCEARNILNSAVVESAILGPFTVGLDSSGPGDVANAGSNGWIAAAVLVPIAVIAGVVLLVLWLRQRKQKPPQKPVSRPPTTAPLNSSSAFSNNNFNSANDPLRPVSANPAGNVYAYPSGQTPRAGRDSPGYGDLGIRNFNGLVGTPHSQQPPQNLSISFDDGGSNSGRPPLVPSSRPAPVTSSAAPNANTSRASTSSQNQSGGYRASPAPYQPYQPSYGRSPSNSSQQRAPLSSRPDATMV